MDSVLLVSTNSNYLVCLKSKVSGKGGYLAAVICYKFELLDT